jgi:hypothetical protein
VWWVGGSTDRAFERHRQQGLGLERELHRQLVEHRLAEAADDQRRGILRVDAALLAVEEALSEMRVVVASCSTTASSRATST